MKTGISAHSASMCFSLLRSSTEQLSVEHVPAEALGGKELVLTCKRCNNDASRHFDAEARRQQRLRQFLSGDSQ